MDLKQLGEIMGKYAHGFFATVDANGFPDMRGWEFQFVRDGRLYFTTSNEKDVYRQMAANPKVAFTCDVDGYHVRISGTAVVVDDPAHTARIYAITDPNVQALYPTAESNGFTVFYIEHGTAKVAKGYDPFETFVF